VGGGVSAPRAAWTPEPEVTEEARKAGVKATVVLNVVVGRDGRVSRIKVVRSAGMGLDERTVNTVKTWRFQPAMRDGQPVAVEMNIEVALEPH
jgi:TonB family protein